jgi:hypothetical protein
VSRYLFIIGILFMPFDNLFFAPSKGWATISPMIFFSAFILYVIEYRSFTKPNISLIKSLMMIFAVIQTLVLIFIYDFESSLLMNSILTLLFGLTFYISLNVFVLGENGIGFNGLVKYIYIGYLLSLVYGVLYFISAKFNLSPITSLFELIQKRNYPGRISMSFTEPSFTSIHVIGVLFFVFYAINYLTNIRININDALRNKFNKLFYIYVLTSVLIVSSMRYIVDLVFVSFIMCLFLLFNKKINCSKKYIGSILTIVLFFTFYLNANLIDGRLNRIISNSNMTVMMNSDPSLAARWFRIVSLRDGLLSEPVEALFGYGLSNANIPFNNGYFSALSVYTNDFTDEVDLLNDNITDQYFNMQLRIISEFGLIIFIGLLIALFDKQMIVLYLVLLYLYLQFDSYAWYTVWLYLFLKNVVSKTANLKGA